MTEKCKCNQKIKGWHTGCAHYTGGQCRISYMLQMKCVMSPRKNTNQSCYRCCPFLNSQEGQALLKIFNENRGIPTENKDVGDK